MEIIESEEQKEEKIEEKWPVEHYQADQHQRRKRENIRNNNVQKVPNLIKDRIINMQEAQ